MGENGSTTTPASARQLRPAFATSTFVIVVTLVRLGLILWNAFPHDIPPWLQSPAFRSIMIRQTDTLLHAKEGYAVKRLSAASQFHDAYQGSFLHIPPLVFMMLRPFLEEASDHCWNVLWGLFLLLVDIFISIELEQIGLCLLRITNDSEERLQRKMPESIRPQRAHLFGIYISPKDATVSGSHTGAQASLNGTNIEDPAIEQPLISMRDAPRLAAILYYCNPITILAGGFFQSFQSVWCLLVLLGVREACPGGSASASAVWLAMAVYGDLWNVVYLIPAALLLSRVQNQENYQRPIVLVAFFVLWYACLQGLSYLLTGDAWTSVLKSTYGHFLGWLDLAPNLGMQWYFCMQMFHRFRRYFVILINGLPYLFLTPMAIRLYRYPIVLVTSFWFVGNLFRPVPTLYDLTFGLCLMLLSTRTVARMGMASFVACCAITVPVSLFVLDYWLWLETGSGNANYLFFQCLAYNVFVGIVFLDFCSSSMKRDKALRITQKLEKDGKTEK